MEKIQVPTLKKEAKITFGSIVIQELQACVALLSEEVDGKELNEKIKQKKLDEFSSQERVLMQLMNIIKQAYKEAEESGMVYYSELSDSISSSLSS